MFDWFKDDNITERLRVDDEWIIAPEDDHTWRRFVAVVVIVGAALIVMKVWG